MTEAPKRAARAIGIIKTYTKALKEILRNDDLLQLRSRIGGTTAMLSRAPAGR